MSGATSATLPLCIGVSILGTGCGNAVTAERIASHLSSEWRTDLVDVNAESMPTAERAAVHFGIHAYRAARLLLSTDRPFVLVLGGTDVNTFAHDETRNAVMQRVLHRAAAVVAFSQSFGDAALRNWPFLSHKLVVIAPAASCPLCGADRACLRNSVDVSTVLLAPHIDAALRPPSRAFFLLPTALRPVKDPLFLLDAFSAWFRADRDRTPFLLLAGPERGDDVFAAEFRSRLAQADGVYFLGVLPRDTLLAMEHSSQCLAVLNTSESEGLANALIEAALIGVPRIARNIAGNRSVVEHNVSGLLFDTPDQCIEQMQVLWNSPQLCVPLTRNARRFVDEHHGAGAEARQYLELMRRAAATPQRSPN
jgi:glycosyltransferase involved in cell wall biosynthesis